MNTTPVFILEHLVQFTLPSIPWNYIHILHVMFYPVSGINISAGRSKGAMSLFRHPIILTAQLSSSKPVISEMQNSLLQCPIAPTIHSPVLAPFWIRVVLGDCCPSSRLIVGLHGPCLQLLCGTRIEISHPNPPLPGPYLLSEKPWRGVTVSLSILIPCLEMSRVLYPIPIIFS